MLGYVLSSSEIKLTCLRLVAESCHSDWTLHRLWFVSYTPVQWQGWTFDMTATVCFCIRPFLNLCCDAGQHGFSQRIFPSRSTKWICWWASLLLLPRDPSLSLFVFFGWKMLWIGTNQSLFASDLPQVHIDQINTWQHRWELSIWYFWFEVACHSGV
jgi:hypothetical protein